jgi:hypothetical protein
MRGSDKGGISHRLEALSPQARAAWRKRFSPYPVACLFAIRAELNGVIRALQASKPRDVDIAAAHWDPLLIAEVRQRLAGRSDRGWSQLQSIYCSTARCQQCPHGPFWYRYRPRRRGHLISVRYVGKPFFSEEALAKVEMSVREPIA